MLAYSQTVLDRARAMAADLFLELPRQPVVILPLPAYQQHSGVTPHYEGNADGAAAATFWLPLDHWDSDTRAAAEITVVHETYPGHHVQTVAARAARPRSVLSVAVFNAAYVEGWANYAEQLAEESHIVDDDYERIQRRAVFGRSLVIDPGINVFGWSRDRAVAYAMEGGLSRESANDVVDRIAVEPAQLTSYELGGLEIRRLREAAQRVSGSRFDIRRFHQRVLEDGPLPLDVLHRKLETP